MASSVAVESPAASGPGWNEFWFQSADSRPLAAVRIAAGLTLLVYAASWGNAAQWLATEGILPVQATHSILDYFDHITAFRGFSLLGDSPAVIVSMQIVIAVAGCFLALGCFSRISAILAWFAFLWFAHRASLVTGTVEPILATILFYLAWSPSGDYWSVDAWRKNKGTRATTVQGLSRAWWLPGPVVANIAIKLLQIHLALLVLSMAEAKLTSPAWWDGEAVWYLTASTLSRPLDLTFLRPMPLIINAWTHAIVLVEVLFPALVWFPRLRCPVLAVASVVWLSLPLLTGEWMFPLAMSAALLAFVPAAWLSAKPVK